MTEPTGPEELFEKGILSALDLELCRTLADLAGETTAEARLAAAFASRAVRQGHVCARLDRLASRPWTDEEGLPIQGVSLPDPEAWLAALGSSALFEDASASSGPGEPRPFVVDARGRVYLRRYHDYERRLARAIVARAARANESVDGPLLKQGLDRLFPRGDPGAALQRRAALIAVLRRLAVVSGGPGTGKTYTVTKILLLLQEQRRKHHRDPYRIELLAPTGKAAQRLGEAVRRGLEEIGCPGHVASAIPTAASTIHRALGYQSRTPTRFHHDRDNPLPRDVVVVDEASMIDLALMTKLVEAVPDGARLVLLGDESQLASVEAGAIFGDLCGGREVRGYSDDLARAAREATGDRLPPAGPGGIADSRVHLEHNYRSQQHPGIAALAAAVRSQEIGAVHEAFDRYPQDVELRPPNDLPASLGPMVLDRYGPLGKGSVAAKLERLSAFRILCVHRRGARGVGAINELVERHLGLAGALETDTSWYEGRPVLVTANDYQVRLFNGDVGVLAPGERRDGSDPDAVVAWFPSEAPNELRQLAPGRLPPHETVFAMSVHKSQGSEFDEIALLLPERPSPILTRELVYTAVTRARRHVIVYGSREILEAAVRSSVERTSGLGDALWGGDGAPPLTRSSRAP